MARRIVTQKLAKDIAHKQGLADDAVDFALKYFAYFFHNPAEGILTPEKVVEYTKQFQTAVGLPIDGDLDAQVVRAMEFMPRCGCKDYDVISPSAFGGVPAWGIRSLSYFIQDFVSGLSQSDQSDLVQMAFNAWSAVANIRASRTTSADGANVIISTGRGQSDNFDGPSGTLAWAYLPPQPNFQGQLLMKFDLDEKWITNPTDRGILYLNVATHEFGHLLGLSHSQQQKALMAPYYSVAITKPQQNDDIPRIQSLYGAATSPPPLPPSPPPPSPPSPPGGKIKVEIYIDSLADLKIAGKDVQDFSLI
jgi:hypothetical protein